MGLAVVKCHLKTRNLVFDCPNLRYSELRARIGKKLAGRVSKNISRGPPVLAQKSVHRCGKAVSGLLGIEHQYRSATSSDLQRSSQARETSTYHDDIIELSGARAWSLFSPNERPQTQPGSGS